MFSAMVGSGTLLGSNRTPKSLTTKKHPAAFLDSHAHSHVLLGVTTIAMKDGVHERFLQGELDIPEIMRTAVFCKQTQGLGNDAFYKASVRRNQFVQLDDQPILVKLTPGEGCASSSASRRPFRSSNEHIIPLIPREHTQSSKHHFLSRRHAWLAAL